jgi:hypothetical protein
MTVKCKCSLGDLIWKIKVFYSIIYNYVIKVFHVYAGLSIRDTTRYFYPPTMVFGSS